jgi:hypothetical protein
MTRFLRFVFPILSSGILATGYFLNGLDWFAGGLLVLGFLWIVGLVIRWNWVPLLGLFAAFGAAALGLVLGHPSVLLIPGGLCALLAWDLAEFHLRLGKASPEDDIPSLERPHLLRLAILVLAGGGLSGFALTFQLKPFFEWTVILMLFTVWGIGRVVYWLLDKEQ